MTRTRYDGPMWPIEPGPIQSAMYVQSMGRDLSVATEDLRRRYQRADPEDAQLLLAAALAVLAVIEFRYDDRKVCAALTEAHNATADALAEVQGAMARLQEAEWERADAKAS